MEIYKIHQFDSSGRRQVFEYKDTVNGNAVCMYARQKPGKEEYDLSLTQIGNEELKQALENGFIPLPFLERVKQAAPDFPQLLRNLHTAPSAICGDCWKISSEYPITSPSTGEIRYECKKEYKEVQQLGFYVYTPKSFLKDLDWEKIVVLVNEGKTVCGEYRQMDLQGGLEFVIRWGKLPCAKDKEAPRYLRIGPERFLSLHNTNGIVRPRQEILNGQPAEATVKRNAIAYRIS